MLAKGDIVELEIVDISNEAKGIARLDGLVVFVNKGLVGDRLRARITKVKKSFALAEAIELLDASKHRRGGVCEYADECGGCPLINLEYAKQIEIKENILKSAILRIAKAPNPTILPPVVASLKSQFHYRNKATSILSAGGRMIKGGNIEHLGDLKIGFYGRGSKRVIGVPRCKIQAKPYEIVARVVADFIKSDNITVWDDTWERGLMRNIVVRTSPSTREVMIIFIINGKKIPNGEKLLLNLDDALYEEGYYLESVYINTNKEVNKKGSIYGDKMELYAGSATINDSVGDVKYEISPRSFYQVNSHMTKKLYDAIRDVGAFKKSDVVLDLYCGVGTIGIYVADLVGEVVGIEVVKDAVLDANRNAVINGLVNCRYVCGRVEEILTKPDEFKMDEDVRSLICDANVIIADPPRSGMDEMTVDSIEKIAPERIIYVSCDPATFARDLGKLRKRGYELESVRLFDMFPNTIESESLALLVREDIGNERVKNR